jgi:RNA polymerase sigma-70 factor (ECF subfamily)
MLALFLGEQHVAEDLAQEALIRLHQRWESSGRPDSPRAWLSTVALNLARSWWRRRYAEVRANRRVQAPVTTALGPDPADVLAVRTAVVALPERQRAAVVLRFYAGLSVAEAAAALRCREGTVKSLTHHAIHQLRRSLAVEDLEELAPHA